MSKLRLEVLKQFAQVIKLKSAWAMIQTEAVCNSRPEFLSAFLTEKLSLKYNLAEERSRARKETWGFYTLPNAFCSLVGEKMASDTLTGP